MLRDHVQKRSRAMKANALCNLVEGKDRATGNGDRSSSARLGKNNWRKGHREAGSRASDVNIVSLLEEMCLARFQLEGYDTIWERVAAHGRSVRVRIVSGSANGIS